MSRRDIKADFRVKLKKYSFGLSQVHLLAHIISSNGIDTDTVKSKEIFETPLSKPKTDLRSFLGLELYYRRFVEDFAKIAAPLHAGTKVESSFFWNSEMPASFDNLKTALTNPPVLMHHNFSNPFIAEIGAFSMLEPY